VSTNKFQLEKRTKADKDDGNRKVATDDSAPELALAIVSAAELSSVNRGNKKQAASALKDMKRCGKTTINSGDELGAVVTLKLDYQTHSHAQGLNKTGSILVHCVWSYNTLWNKRGILGACG